MRTVVVLGVTGSIGRQALEVIRSNRSRLTLLGAAARSSKGSWGPGIEYLGPRHVVSAEEDGAEAIEQLAASEEADIVLNGMVGAAGLPPTLAALQAGKSLALANKESVVAAGDIINACRERSGGVIIPVDSEHSAIFQCLLGEDRREVRRIVITASGGPFRGKPMAQLKEVTPEQAARHPRWDMGPKISVDSATMMNKGLEVIEAHFLFGVPYEKIEVVIHPQSIVHSLVEFADGSVKAHLGPTDMRVPIQYALSHPERWTAPAGQLDFQGLGHLDFEPLQIGSYPCFDLALGAARLGGSFPAVLSAANEVAVEAFLDGRLLFTDIPVVIERVLEEHGGYEIAEMADFERADSWARRRAGEVIGR